MFVVIEGIDGCGKGTQVEKLAAHIARSFSMVTTLKYPDRSTPIGKMIDQWLKGTMGLGQYSGYMDIPCGKPMFDPANTLDHALANQALLLANKIEVQHQLLEAFQRGHVVADRYTPSGVCYGAADGLDFDYLYECHHQPLFQPDLYILLDISANESFHRRPVRQETYERDRDRLSRAREFYLRMAEEPAEQDRWMILDGTQKVSDLSIQIADAVECLYERCV